MKKIISILALAICALGCMDKAEYMPEDESSASGPAVTGADAIAYVINQNIQALHAIVTASENKGFVISAAEYTDNYGTGYQFILTTEDTVVLYGNSVAPLAEKSAAAHAAAPMIEAEKDAESGIWYWTLEGNRLKDALGKYIPVSNPYVSVRAMGMNWCYSVDGGVEWTQIRPIEALENPYTLQVTARGNIQLGNLVYTPAWQPLFYYKMEEEASVAAGFTIKVDYTIEASETETPSIAVTNNGGWTATVTQPTDGKGLIKVTCPEGTTKGTIVTVTFTDGSYQVAQDIEMLVKDPNAWEAIVQAGADYSMFRDLVARYNVVNEEGEVTGNTYLDMYNETGAATWNMRMEIGTATLLLPSNTVLEATYAEAKETLKNTLGREPNARDQKKFDEWIIRACFYSEELTSAELKGSADLNAISGSTSEGKTIEAALWRPSAQGLSGKSRKLINGNAFYLSKLHIPNYLIIYRIKTRMADTYNADKATAGALITPINGTIATRTCKGITTPFGGWTMSDGTVWPSYYYNVFNIKFPQEAKDNKLDIGVEWKAFVLGDDNKVSQVKIPAGTYTLTWGCSARNNGQTYDISYKIDDASYTLVQNIAHNSYQYDRSGNGWAEYYREYDDETASDKNYLKYDADGGEIGTVTVTGEGFHEISFSQISHDLWEKGGVNDGDKGCLTIFHWCLRPTTSVY